MEYIKRERERERERDHDFSTTKHICALFAATYPVTHAIGIFSQFTVVILVPIELFLVEV
jgi:hypothetical protein